MLAGKTYSGKLISVEVVEKSQLVHLPDPVLLSAFVAARRKVLAGRRVPTADLDKLSMNEEQIRAWEEDPETEKFAKLEKNFQASRRHGGAESGIYVYTLKRCQAASEEGRAPCEYCNGRELRSDGEVLKLLGEKGGGPLS
jgi:hypothetical protein